MQNIKIKNGEKKYSVELVLKYIKWKVVVEDTRYPPFCKYLGRKLPFIALALAYHYPELYKKNLEALGRILKIW